MPITPQTNIENTLYNASSALAEIAYMASCEIADCTGEYKLAEPSLQRARLELARLKRVVGNIEASLAIWERLAK